MRSDLETRECIRAGAFGGFVMVSIGIVFLLVNLGILNSVVFHTWWPLLLILLGLARLARWAW